MSINYELAKELEDAGFPRENILESIDGAYQFPTLSELIEACGDNLYALYNHVSSWQAHSNSDQWDTEIALGKTAEEVVAKLWLALNKK